MKLVPVPQASCPAERDRKIIEESYWTYTSDESRMTGGMPSVIYMPRTPLEVAAAVAETAADGECITVSGGRTGLVAGAVPPEGSRLLSLDWVTGTPELRFDEGAQSWTVRAPAGVRLEQLQSALRTGEVTSPGSGDPPTDLFYPVDPTETSASLGGTVATNASGARTLFYGPTRDWVVGVTVVLPDGRSLTIRRGDTIASGNRLAIGDDLSFTFLPVASPATKHTGGYHLQEGMDLIDLFVGGEGTLAVVTEVELRLAKRPLQTLGLVVFPRTECCSQIVAAIQSDERLTPLALEYMDRRSLELLRAYRAEQGESSGVPVFADEAVEALYVEAGMEDDEALEEFTLHLEDALSGCEVSMDHVWAGFSQSEIQSMKRFRHALPERVNAIIGERKREVPELTKVGTDMAVPLQALPEMMASYRDGLASAALEHVIFGHIGNGHLHVNILPRSAAEREQAWELYHSFAEHAVKLGGSVSAEHGIGRLKKSFMNLQYTGEELSTMRKVKQAFDPAGTLNPGVML
jgi:D-lactate dehydrogenase (cytochrome)